MQRVGFALIGPAQRLFEHVDSKPGEYSEKDITSFPNFVDWRAQNQTLAGMAAFYHDAIGQFGRDRARAIYQATLDEMDRIARAVEPSLGYRHELPNATEHPTIGNAMSNAACDLAEALGAAAILVPTFTGRTASAVSRLRPRRPIATVPLAVLSPLNASERESAWQTRWG